MHFNTSGWFGDVKNNLAIGTTSDLIFLLVLVLKAIMPCNAVWPHETRYIPAHIHMQGH